jgi:hypothetical protein
VELQGREIIEFDVLGTEEDEPADDENELAGDVKNKGDKKNKDVQVAKIFYDTLRVIFNYKIQEGHDGYGNPYKMRNMTGFFAFLDQKSS